MLGYKDARYIDSTYAPTKTTGKQMLRQQTQQTTVFNQVNSILV